VPVSQDDLAGCVILGLRELEGRLWPAGPVLDCRVWATPDGKRAGGPEAKSFCVDLDTVCTWVDAVERAPGGPDAAVQLLRRLWFCDRVPGGGRVDQIIKTDQSRYLRVPAVRQAVLDGLTRTGLLVVDPSKSDRNVDLSHVFVLLDYALNGDGPAAVLLKQDASSLTSVQAMLSWLGDLASVWAGLQSKRQRWIDAHPGQTPARGTPSEPDTEAWWLEQAFAGRSPIGSLLGDLDGVILAAELVNDSSQSVAALLNRYYTTPATLAPTDLNVGNRLSLFVQVSDPAIPTTTSGGQVSVTADTAKALRTMVDASSRLFATAATADGGWWGGHSAAGEADSDWGQWAIGEIGDRFAGFLGALASNSSFTGVWPASGPPAPVNLGYASTVRGRAAEVLASSDPNAAPVDMLEAITQYYITSNEPWGQPPKAGALLSPAWLGDFTGQKARSARPSTSSSDVVLDDVVPWSEIWPAPRSSLVHRDLIKLDAATTRASGVFQIVAVNASTRTVTLDSDPGLGQNASPWTIIRRPRLVIIDPFGFRPDLSGSAATLASGANVAAVRIDIDPNTPRALGGVNMGIDTILLDDDAGVPRLPFRVFSIDMTNPSSPLIGLDRPPVLSQPTRWQIPAGIGGDMSAFAAVLPPSPGAGCDHYDAMLYLIYSDSVLGAWPWTTFTSFRQGVSSLRGNRRYAARAFYSSDSYKNHSLAIVTMPNRAIPMTPGFDSVPGRDYYAGVSTLPKAANTTAPPADGPQRWIRVHYGNVMPPNTSTGSAACQVSPKYFEMRSILIQTYLDEQEQLAPGSADKQLQKVAAAKDYNAAVAAYSAVLAAQWNDKVVAELYVIHPDERSSQPVVPLKPWVES
jgi:hypothetical protein